MSYFNETFPLRTNQLVIYYFQIKQPLATLLCEGIAGKSQVTKQS